MILDGKAIMATVRNFLGTSKKPTLFVIGDHMRDIYRVGRLYSKCQEGCPKFVTDRTVEVYGGAGNVAQSLANWPVRVYAGTPGIVGDPALDRLPITIKERLMDIDTGRCVFRRDIDHILSEKETEQCQRAYLATMDIIKFDAVILSDYAKGTLTTDFIKVVARRCKDMNIPCVLDAKRHPNTYDHPYLTIKANLDWRWEYGISAVNVVTRGAAMPSIRDGDGHVRISLLPHVNVVDKPSTDYPRVECVNHVGAGDCFTAHLTLGLMCGLSLKAAAALAYSAGRVYVTKPYNAPPAVEAIGEDLGAIFTRTV